MSRPAVYIPLESFPKNAAGKIDRAALPDACDALSATLTTAEAEYEPPSTEDEKKMAPRRTSSRVAKWQASRIIHFIQRIRFAISQVI